MSDLINSQIQIWRQKAREGTLTTEEQRAAVDAIRKERLGAGVVSAKSKEKKVAAKEKAKPVDSDALLGELGI